MTKQLADLSLMQHKNMQEMQKTKIETLRTLLQMKENFSASDNVYQ